MASETTASKGSYPVSEIAARAGHFLEANHPGPHKDKRVARELGVSPGMAKLLRNGFGWTVRRLEQAARFYGTSFSEFVFQKVPEANELHDRLDRIEAALAELRNDLRGSR